MNPEELEQMQGGQELPAEEIPQEDMMEQQQQFNPMEGMPPEMAQQPQFNGEFPPMQDEMEAPDPSEMLNEVLMQYMDFVIGIKNDMELDKGLKSKIMAEQATSLSSLFSIQKDNPQMEAFMKRAELDMKYQEHQMDMEMKKADMEMKAQENQMNLAFKQQENQMKLQQQHEAHQHKLVQGQEGHQMKMEQQKQAAQSKQSNNSGSDKG